MVPVWRQRWRDGPGKMLVRSGDGGSTDSTIAPACSCSYSGDASDGSCHSAREQMTAKIMLCHTPAQTQNDIIIC